MLAAGPFSPTPCQTPVEESSPSASPLSIRSPQLTQQQSRPTIAPTLVAGALESRQEQRA